MKPTHPLNILPPIPYDKRFTIPEEDKQKVRDLHAQGLAPAEIRRQTGLSFTAIRRITLPHAEPKPPPGRWRKYYDKDKQQAYNAAYMARRRGEQP